MSERLLLDITKIELTDDAPSEQRSRRLVPLLDIVGPPIGFPNSPDPASLKAIRREIGRGAKRSGIIVGVLSTILALPAVGTLVPLILRYSWRRLLVFFVAMLLLLVIYDRLLLPIFRRQYRPLYTRACLKQGLCPFCLYVLPEAEHEAEVTVCPECGGVWNRAAKRA